MRKLFTGILLAAALPASANIATDLEAGLSADQAITNAVAACDGGVACQEAAIEEALAAGIDLDSVVSAAIASGVDTLTVQQAAVEAGQSLEDVASAIISAAINATAAGPAQPPVFTPSDDSATGQTTTTGISPAS